MVSVLLCWYSESHKDLLCHTRKFLIGLYEQYVKRASENLGVPYKSEEEKNEEDLRKSHNPQKFLQNYNGKRDLIPEEAHMKYSQVVDRDTMSKLTSKFRPKGD